MTWHFVGNLILFLVLFFGVLAAGVYVKAYFVSRKTETDSGDGDANDAEERAMPAPESDSDPTPETDSDKESNT